MVKPLQKRTMTLDELQRRTLDVLQRTRKQFYRAAHEEGLSDYEFIDQVIEPLQLQIRQDRKILGMADDAK